jgi:hypothetical protein
MNNWNYEEAKQFVDAIENDVTRTMTSLFLNQLVILALQRYAAPETDFDLLFFVKIVSKIAGDPKLMQMCLNGEPLDVGWEGFAEAFSDKHSVEKTKGPGVVSAERLPHGQT